MQLFVFDIVVDIYAFSNIEIQNKKIYSPIQHYVNFSIKYFYEYRFCNFVYNQLNVLMYKLMINSFTCTVELEI